MLSLTMKVQSSPCDPTSARLAGVRCTHSVAVTQRSEFDSGGAVFKFYKNKK